MTPTRRQRVMASELGSRIVSAVVLILIVFAAVWAGGTTFALVCALLSALCFHEWRAMVQRTPFNTPEALLTVGFGALLMAALVGGFVYVLVLFIVLGLALELTHDGAERHDVRWIGLGALYCIIPVVALPTIREVGGDYGVALILFLFLAVWVTDVAAYFAGRAIGGPKVLPAVSPKKTWSGAIGGMVGAMAVGLIFGSSHYAFPVVGTMIAALVLSIVSQMGDFFESWVKRRKGVKDSGRLIPGHGGFLDRIDGLVPAALSMAVVVALGQGG